MKRNLTKRCGTIGLAICVGTAVILWPAEVVRAAEKDGADAKKILLIAGAPSHGPGDHEFRAGCLLLKQCLDQVPGIVSQVASNGWPASLDAFAGVDAVFIYADGGGRHPALQGDRPEVIKGLVKKGVGLGFGHYAVEVPAGESGAMMQDWLGGFYEHQYSVNPMWTPNFGSYLEHPVTRGVGPFALLDEWYFNMRWRDDRQGIRHILVAKPSDQVRAGPYVYPKGPYDHIVAESGREETMMWTFERPDGGRSFGFTGGHKHVNWAEESCRKVVLNALLWIAKAEVPDGGVNSLIAPEDLAKNLDPKGKSAAFPNVTGRWVFRVETANGIGEPAFELVHAGQNLIGTYDGLFGRKEIVGTVRNRELEIDFDVEYEGQSFPITYKGSIENEKRLKGTVRFGEVGEGTWTAER